MSPTVFLERSYRFCFFSREEKRILSEMKSKTNGKSTLKQAVEVTCISSYGVWIIIKDIEFYLPYSDFNWFKEAKVQDVLNVKLIGERHLYWPDLDIDLDIDSIKDIEKYPLVFNG